MFLDKTFNKNEIIEYCENLLLNSPIIQKLEENFKLRDYQIDAIDIIKNNIETFDNMNSIRSKSIYTIKIVNKIKSDVSLTHEEIVTLITKI